MDVDGQTDILVSDSCLTDGSIWLLWDSARWSVTINKKMQVEQQDETREAMYEQTKH